jgi:hypothetical protein
MLWGSRAIFLRLLVRTEENKSVKEFVCFSTPDVFVPVSQLSTRDLFYFLENLKIRQDILSWDCCLVRRALWLPYSRFFLEQKCSRKCEFLSIWGDLQSQLWCQYYISLTHLFSERCLNCWLVKEIITFESRASCGELFYLKEFETWQVCEMLSDISLGGVFTLLLQLPRWSPCRLIKIKHMDFWDR